MLKEKLKSGIKNLALGLVLSAVAITSFGCGDAEQTSGEPTQSGAKTQNAQEQKITISCAGDCTLGTDAAFGGVTFPVEVQNQGGDYSYFLKNVQKYFANDDLTIVNFEGTLTERGTREDKTFAFRGKPEYTKVLTEGSVEAVTLANNHSRDYGDVSMEDTKKYLDEAGIAWFENLNIRVMDVKGVKVGLVGLYALNGSAEGNLPKAMEQVKNGGAEVIIVQIHWGVEGDNYPQDSQISLAHKAIDSGADLVIGHHPHVLQGMECYKGRMIAYSMGNFCFGGNQNPRDKDTMIYRQTFTVKDGKVTDYNDYSVVPCSLSSTSSRNNYQPTPAEGSEKQRIADKIQKFSDKLGNINVKFEGVSAQKSDSETRAEGKTDDSENRSGGNKTIETENSIIL